MNSIRRSVSNKLKQYRKLMGLTQEDFADKYNISVKTIAQWEQCNAEVPLYIIMMLRKELNISIDEIYGLTSSYKNMNDYEYVTCLADEFSNNKVAKLHYINKLDIESYKYVSSIMKGDFMVFLDGYDFVLNYDNKETDSKIRITFNNQINSDIVDFLINKEIITYDPLVDYNSVSDEIEISISYYIEKRLALIILNRLINSYEDTITDTQNQEIIDLYNKKIDEAEKEIKKIKKSM